MASFLVETAQSHSQNFSTLHGEPEEDENHPTTSILPSSSKDHKVQLAFKQKSRRYGYFVVSLVVVPL
jgi:hypothetical protein